MKVAIVMGSKSDYPKLEEGINFLEKYGVEVVVRILSAHRTPKELVSFIESIDGELLLRNLQMMIYKKLVMISLK